MAPIGSSFLPRHRTGVTWRALVVSLALTVATVSSAIGAARRAEAWPAAPPAQAVSERIADLAFDLDYDMERIFRFMADEIRYEPYEGILRGALGTLDAGAGNSLDQALLLAALLDESAISYRFARAPLDEATAARLAESALLDAADIAALTERTLAGGPYPPSVDPPAPDPADPAEEATIEAAAADALAASGARIDASVATITSALADAGVTLGGPATSDPGSADLAELLPEGEVSGHTWVQVAFGTDWLDLDPTLSSEVAVGAGPAAPAESLEALPDDLRHRVRFEVLLEQVRGSGLQVTPVIEHEGYADELAGQAIVFSHVPPDAVQRLGMTIAGLMGDARQEYLPILRLRGATIVSDVPASFGVSVGDAGDDGGGGILDDSGGLFDEASPGVGTLRDGEASAEWLAVTVTSPGAGPVTERRTVFDRVPPDIRRSGEATPADVQPITLIPFAASGALDFAPLLGADAFAVTTGPTSEPALLARTAAPGADTTALLAAAYSGLRDVIAATNSGDDLLTFVDRPGVASFAIDFGMDGDEPTMTTGLDIWHRSLAALPLSGSELSVADARLTAGVIEHIAERVAMEAGPAELDLADRSIGVSRVFEEAAAAGIPTLVLQGSLPAEAAYDPVASALIEEALAAGDAVIVPAAPVEVGGRERLGWWRVDPVTGATADRMDDGAASQVTEETILVRMAICMAVFAPAIFTIMNALMDGPTSKAAGVFAGLYTAFWILNSADVPAAVATCRGV